MNRIRAMRNANDVPATRRVKSVETAAPAGRLGRRDWIHEGQDILRDIGISGLKLAALTQRLNVSTGSFYHHFSDFDEYLGAVAEAYSVDRVRSLIERARQESKTTSDRITTLARLSLDDHTFDLDRAMRIWATMDPRAQATVQQAEGLVLDFLAETFRALGFRPAEARLRAGILLSVNVMPLAIGDSAARRNFFKGALRLLTAPAV